MKSLHCDNLSQMYPNVEDELCSKHSILLNHLANQFRQLYSVDCTHILSVKSLVDLMRTPTLSLTLPLESGAVLLCSGTLPTAFLILNGLGQELIFYPGGKLSQGTHAWSEELSLVIQLATEDVPLARKKGGVLLLQKTVNKLNSKQSLLTALFLAVLLLNESDIPLEEIMRRMIASKIMGSQEQIHKLFLAEHNQLLLSVEEETTLLSINDRLRFVVCQLGEEQQTQPRPSFNLKEKYSVESIYALESVDSKEEEAYLECEYSSLQLLRNLISKDLTFEEFMCKVQKQDFQIGKPCIVAAGTHLLAIGHSRDYLVLLNRMKSFLKQNELNPEEMQCARGNVQNRLFASSASKGVAILQPKGAMWFE